MTPETLPTVSDGIELGGLLVWPGLMLLVAALLVGRVLPVLAYFEDSWVRRARRLRHSLWLIGVTWALTGLLGRAMSHMPEYVAVAVLLVASALVIFSGLAHDLLGGMIAVYRLNIVPGSHVNIKAAQGLVDRVDLTRTRLIGPEGRKIFVPNRDFLVEQASVRAGVSGRPAFVTLPVKGHVSAEVITELTSRLHFLPYRVKAGEVSVDVTAQSLSLLVRVWPPLSCRLPEEQISNVALAVLRENSL